MDDLGRRIAEARRACGLTQETVAARIREQTGRSVPSVLVSRWERGATTPSTEFMLPLAAALGVATEDLFRGDEGEHAVSVQPTTPAVESAS